MSSRYRPAASRAFFATPGALNASAQTTNAEKKLTEETQKMRKIAPSSIVLRIVVVDPL